MLILIVWVIVLVVVVECEPAIGQEELVGSDTSDCCECVDLECCMENAVDLCGYSRNSLSPAAMDWCCLNCISL